MVSGWVASRNGVLDGVQIPRGLGVFRFGGFDAHSLVWPFGLVRGRKTYSICVRLIDTICGRVSKLFLKITRLKLSFGKNLLQCNRDLQFCVFSAAESGVFLSIVNFP